MFDFVFISYTTTLNNEPRLAIFNLKDGSTYYLNTLELFRNLKYPCEFMGYFKRLVQADPQAPMILSPVASGIVTTIMEFNRIEF